MDGPAGRARRALRPGANVPDPEQEPGRAEPETWDEATDLRRFWWLAPPFLLAALTAIIVSVSGQYTGEPVETATRDAAQVFAVGQRPSVVIDVEAGNVTVVVGPPGSVMARIHAEGSGRTFDIAKMRVDQMLLSLDTEGDGQVTIQAQDPTRPSLTRADVVVQVPADANVAIDTGDGLVKVMFVRGNLRVRSGHGDVEVWLPADESFVVGYKGAWFTHTFGDLVPIVGDAPFAWVQRGESPTARITLSAADGNLRLLKR